MDNHLLDHLRIEHLYLGIPWGPIPRTIGILRAWNSPNAGRIHLGVVGRNHNKTRIIIATIIHGNPTTTTIRADFQLGRDSATRMIVILLFHVFCIRYPNCTPPVARTPPHDGGYLQQEHRAQPNGRTCYSVTFLFTYHSFYHSTTTCRVSAGYVVLVRGGPPSAWPTPSTFANTTHRVRHRISYIKCSLPKSMGKSQRNGITIGTFSFAQLLIWTVL